MCTLEKNTVTTAHHNGSRIMSVHAATVSVHAPCQYLPSCVQLRPLALTVLPQSVSSRIHKHTLTGAHRLLEGPKSEIPTLFCCTGVCGNAGPFLFPKGTFDASAGRRDQTPRNEAQVNQNARSANSKSRESHSPSQRRQRGIHKSNEARNTRQHQEHSALPTFSQLPTQ